MAELRGADTDLPDEVEEDEAEQTGASDPPKDDTSDAHRLSAVMDSSPVPAAESEPGEGEDTENEPKGWDAKDVVDDEKRPDRDSIHLDEERRTHILDGDAVGGGHRHGTGRPGKTEFPESWDDDTALEHVESVARDPDTARLQKNGKWLVTGTREEVDLEAVVWPDGGIVTGYPTGGPGVVRNPKESES